MRSRPGALLLAVALAAFTALTSGCATKTIAGKPAYGAPKATGLAAEPIDKIVAAVQKFAAKQQSVHAHVQIDGKLFSDVDVSYGGGEGVTTVEKKKVQFRTIGETTYVRDSGKWSEAEGQLGETIRGQTRFKDIVQEVYSFNKSIKKVTPKTPDIIVLSDGKGTEVEVANDPDSAAMKAFHIKNDSELDELLLSHWSEKTLHLQAPSGS